MSDRYWDSDKSEWVWPDLALQDKLAALFVTALQHCSTYGPEDTYISVRGEDLTDVVVDGAIDLNKLAGVVIEAFQKDGWRK